MWKTIPWSSACIYIGLALLIHGCAGTIKNMREVPPESVMASPEDGKAMVVFMRPSSLGYAIQSSVFEVKDEDLLLIGIVAAKTKVTYQLDPGKHLFMLIGESADYMTVDLLPGKTYYALITPRFGVWKARFSLKPIHQEEFNTPEFKEWIDDCKLVEKMVESDNWAANNVKSIQSKHDRYYPEWLKKPETEKPHLFNQDGV
jgi:hypothetical protein